MKKLLIGIFCLLAFSTSHYAYATYQPQKLGYVEVGITTMTATAVSISTPPYIGNIIDCFNCVANGGVGTICISTSATTANSWVLSTGTVCK